MAWSTPTTWSAISIALDGLATTAYVTSTSTIANGTGRDIFIDISIRLASIAPSSSGPCIEVHLLGLLDDGNTYADVVRASDVIPLTPATSSKAIQLFGLRLSPGSYRIAIVNQSGTTLGTGNSLAYRTYSPG